MVQFIGLFKDGQEIRLSYILAFYSQCGTAKFGPIQHKSQA